VTRAEFAEEVRAAKGAIQLLSEKNLGIMSELEELKSENAALTSKLSASKEDVQILTDALAQAKRQCDASSAMVLQLQSKLDQLHQSLEQQAIELEQHERLQAAVPQSEIVDQSETISNLNLKVADLQQHVQGLSQDNEEQRQQLAALSAVKQLHAQTLTENQRLTATMQALKLALSVRHFFAFALLLFLISFTY
jgi:chromosome segregation ATPase